MESENMGFAMKGNGKCFWYERRRISGACSTLAAGASAGTSSASGRRRMDFTLNELLVVMGVIAITMSLILPAVAGVKRKAYEASCKGNLRQIGQCSMNYVNDFNGYVVPSYFYDDGDEISFMTYFFNNGIDEEGMFRCPQYGEEDFFDPEAYDESVHPGKKTLAKGSYVFNTVHDWDGSGGCHAPDLTGIDPTLTNSVERKRAKGWTSDSNAFSPLRMIKARKPAATIYITDFIRKVPSYRGSVGDRSNRRQDASSLTGWTETDHGDLPVTTGSECRDVGEHHSGGFNVLYGDGHADLLLISNPEQWVAWIQ